MPLAPFTIAPLPNNWSGSAQDLLDFLQANLTIEFPQAPLVVVSLPLSDMGPVVYNGSWYLWDNGTASYQLQSSGLPIGFIAYFGQDIGSVDSNVWISCSGQAIPRAAPYDTLFSKIGITWGPGDGSLTFNVPDTRGRVLVGVGTGTSLTARALGDSFGEEKHILAANEAPPLGTTTKGAGAQACGDGTYTGPATNGHNVIQPSLAATCAIKYA